MKRFSTISECVKCGYDGGGYQPHHSASYQDILRAIVRRCWNCGYTWHEAPLDDATPQAPEAPGFWRRLVQRNGATKPAKPQKS